MLALMGILLLLLATHVSYINMAVKGSEATTLNCISELLNPEECHELYIWLAISQKDVEQPSKEGEFSPSSQWQTISNMAQCKEALSHWLEVQRGTVDWDRLARALRKIGRPDVSRELKKSLSKNRSLEPKWDRKANQTAGAPKTALLVENKMLNRRSHHVPSRKRRTVLLKKRGWDFRTFLQKLLPLPLSNLSLQQCIGPVIRILIASIITGLILWLISVYYIICWNLRQCLFASGVHYNTSPVRENMNWTVIWNYQSSDNTTDDGEDQNTSAEEDAREDELF
ncbi:transmembrane and death domain protein 1-like [Hemicordylus capensis]|uniref:transmembrane and death domain protein 1-like n=1 Tax=Hemicordylus capensis TaxID=884348 RepID=UPI002302D051|nr:transmembrane and death domain protein 1-like [Hemicordylus capensis]